MKKRIAIQDLQPGMYIAGMDQSWFQTPFLRHKWLVKRDDEITLLRNYGIQAVFIDTEKGRDVTIATNVQEASQTTTTADQSASPSHLDLGPDPEDIEAARHLRAEAISTLDVFFRQMGNPSSQHLMEVRGVVSTLLDGLFEHQAAIPNGTNDGKISSCWFRMATIKKPKNCCIISYHHFVIMARLMRSMGKSFFNWQTSPVWKGTRVKPNPIIGRRCPLLRNPSARNIYAWLPP